MNKNPISQYIRYNYSKKSIKTTLFSKNTNLHLMKYFSTKFFRKKKRLNKKKYNYSKNTI